MSGNMEKEIVRIIYDEVLRLNRPDLFRTPIIAYSSASDERYLDLKEIIGDWHLNPAQLLPDVKSAISYFVPFTKEVVYEPKNIKDGSPLWAEAYEVINDYFNHINDALSVYILSQGFSAKTIPATHTYDPKDMKCMWSHRSAAAISEMGTFGLNRLLITEKGSGGRFCTVLTSALLEPKHDSAKAKCRGLIDGSCGLCHKICPVGALSPDGIDMFACNRELLKNRDIFRERTALYETDICGKCISICPYTYIE